MQTANQPDQTNKKYDTIPTIPSNVSDDDDKSDSDTLSELANKPQTKLQHDKTMTSADDINLDMDDEHIDQPNTTGTKPAEYTRLNTLSRMTTFHNDALLRTDTAMQRIYGCQCPDFQAYDILVCIGVIFSILCFVTVVYGIHAGSELHALWSEYTPDEIDTDCNGKYRQQFTYGWRQRDWGRRFTSMIWIGSGQLVGYVIVCCIACWFGNGGESRWKSPGMMVLYTWLVGGVFVFVWWESFIECLQFYNRVQEFCGEDTVIYEGTMEIFDWFYPLVIFEIVKGSIMVCVFAVFYVWLKCCN